MASIRVCGGCRQALQQSSRHAHQIAASHNRVAPPRILDHVNHFSSGRSNAATPAAAPQPYKPKAASTSSAVSQSATQGNEPPKPQSRKPTTAQTIAKSLRESLPAATETYVAYGVCEKLVKECARQAEYTIPQASEDGIEVPKTKDGEDLGVGSGWWYDNLGLPPTFNTWAQITFLHMYLLTVRFRAFPAAHAQPWHQHLIDHFSYLAEDKMVKQHNMVARAVRNKYLKDLFVQWRGLQAGYDEGLIRGDAVLATAIWRNVFKANQDIDFRGVAEVVSYVRNILKALGEMGDEQAANGELSFGGNPGVEKDETLIRSRMMDTVDAPNQADQLKNAADNRHSPSVGRMMPTGGR